MIPIYLSRRFQLTLKLLPRLRVLHIILRTQLSGHIIMPDHLIRRKPVTPAEPGRKRHKRLVRLRPELPGLIRDTAFDRDRIIIPVIRRIGNLIAWDTLYDLTVQPDDEMTARVCLAGIF